MESVHEGETAYYRSLLREYPGLDIATLPAPARLEVARAASEHAQLCAALAERQWLEARLPAAISAGA